MADTPALVTIDDIKSYAANNPGPFVDSKTGDSLTPSFANSQPTSPVVTSSNSAQNFVDNTGNNIATAASNPPVIPGTSNPTGAAPIPYDPSADPSVQADITNTNQAIQTQRDSLKARQDAEIAQLTSQETTDKADLEQSQKNETGTSSRNLAYLQQGGNSASAQAYLNSLEITHGKEMDTLVAKYNSAIQAARNAYADKDFDLAQSMVKNAKDIKDQAATRNQQFLDYTLKLRTAANDEAKNQLEAQKTQQAFIKDNGITGRYYQYPGNPTVYDSLTGQPVTAQQYQASGGKGGDYSDIQVITPQAQSADGKSFQDYQTQGGTLGYSDFLKWQANLKDKAVNYSMAKDQTQKDQISKYGNEFANEAGPDGYVSPEKFKLGYQAWLSEGGNGKDFLDAFSGFVNPADAQDYGNSFVTKVSSNN